MGVRDGDVYIHVDMTHPSFNTMKTDAAAKHKANYPKGELSIAPNVAGTEAIVKVRGGKNWSPGWMNAPFVIRVYDASEHDQVKTLMRQPGWQPP